MRRFTSVFGLLLALLWLPFVATAENDGIFNAQQNPKAATMAVTQTENAVSQLTQVYKDQALKADQSNVLSKKALKKVGTKSITTISDLTGEYVMTYESLTSSGNDGGKSVSIAPLEGSNDTIVITNFWDTGYTVKAAVDLVNMKISIPNQVIGTSTNYGEFDLAVCTTTGTPDRVSAIEGTISGDGLITIDSWWGMFIMTGSYADYFFGVYYNSEIEMANATMSYKIYRSSSASYETVNYNVVVDQVSENVLSVKNLANYGMTIEMELQRDSTTTIASQIARADATNGDWYTYSVTYKDDLSGLSSYSTTITTNKATDNRTISWGNWTLICNSYYLGAIVEGKLETTFDITYPTLSVSEFEGEGTEASPYLIKQLDDLILLGDKVNGVTEYNYGATTKYASVFRGAYFRLENDIDMAGYRFTPIGDDWYHQFGGVFDGNGHTLKGLSVSTGTSGYAALFGRCDTTSVIKNLSMSAPVVTTSGYYAAGIVGWSLGTIDNCHVTDATITNAGSFCAAGIAGIANIVTNCTVNNATIVGAGGYAAGVVGQLNTTIDNCSAVNINITAGGRSSSYPSGGVVGSLYYGAASNCYFVGTIDGRSVSGLYIGGIAGTCYQGSVKNCYATAYLYGTDSNAIVGGVVASLYGSVEDSYSTSYIISISSEYVGGVVGYVRSYTDDAGNPAECTVKNCYSAGFLDPETYQYDTTTQIREIIGKVQDGANPTLENLYFDKQIIDFKSARFGATTAQMTSASGLSGFDSSVWTFAEGYYPRLKGMDDTEAAKLSASALLMDENSSIEKLAKNAKLNLLGETQAYFIINNGTTLTKEGYYSTIEGDSIKIKNEFGSDTLYFYNPGVGSKYLIVKVAPIPFEGAGTEASPYLIKTKDDLISLANITTNKKQLFPDTYFQMTNDIDMELDTAFIGICTDKDDAYNRFEGHFDGNGYAIHKLKLPDSFEWETAPSDPDGIDGTPNTSTTAGLDSYKGFMGRLSSNGSLKNLTIAADCEFSMIWASSGALVGYNAGLIENCKNYADVTGYSCWIGGITGQNLKGGIIRNCFNAGEILSGYMDAGGIAGSNAGLITGCQNVGDVGVTRLSKFISSDSRLRFAGGIEGTSGGGRIENCVNSGLVYANARVGGLSGSLDEATISTYQYTNDVINSINYGTIIVGEDESEVGSIGGVTGTKGVISGVYYDGQITVYKACGNADLDGATAASTATLTSGTALEGFSTDIWDFTAGVYPVLKSFAQEELVIASRGIIATLADGETASNVKSAITLSTSNDVEWVLSNGSVYKIENNQVIVPAEVTTVVVDTLLASCGGIMKPIVLKSTPEVPLDGEGTESSPYLITSTADWNEIAVYMANCSENMQGKYLQITNDLDFTETEMTSFGYDRVTNFNGTLDGNGKTISGFSKASDASYYGPVFVEVGPDAYIYNLTVDGSVTSTYTYVGGVVGHLYGKLENVSTKGSVTTTKSYSGGMVAYAYTGAELIDCVNNGTLSTSSTYSGGLVAYSQTGVKYTTCGNEGALSYTGTTANCYMAGLIACCYPDTLIGCYNKGTLTVANAEKSGGLAGLIAYANAASSDPAYYMEECYNSSNISSLANNAGLILTLNTSGNSALHLESCFNTGDISSTSTATKSSTYTSGISCMYSPGSIFHNCWNSGTILSEKPVYAAGIVSYYKGTPTADEPVKIIGCYNTGDIIASGNQGAGIMNQCTHYVTIDSCYNTGTIEGGFGLAGIVNCVSQATDVISNCWNTGNVTTSTNRAGGIIGYNASAQATVTNCFNLGDIASTGEGATNAYGIGGIAGQGAANFSNIYNMGNVSGAAHVGGLVGRTVANKTTIDKAYTTGIVTAPDSCGMAIGVTTVDNGRYWKSDNSVKDVYYLSELKSENAVDTLVATPISSKELAKLDLGEGWEAGDTATYPRLATLADLDVAKVNAAIVVLADCDTLGIATKEFIVGAPDGVVWTTDNSKVTVIDGGIVAFAEPFTGTLTMKATCGDAFVEHMIPCDIKVISGVDNIGANGKEVVNEEFYNVSGIKVAGPTDGEKAVYIVVKTYDDGTTAIVKEAR